MNLTPREYAILRDIAQGMSIKILADRMDCTPASVHVHCSRIRKKTGILKTRPQECRDFLHGHGKELYLSGKLIAKSDQYTLPTQAQLRALQLYASGYDYHGIAEAMGVSKVTASGHLSAGFVRAGLTNKINRRKHLQSYLAELPQTQPVMKNPMADPMFS